MAEAKQKPLRAQQSMPFLGEVKQCPRCRKPTSVRSTRGVVRYRVCRACGYRLKTREVAESDWVVMGRVACDLVGRSALA